MKKNLLIGILLMSVLPYGLMAQESRETSSTKPTLVVKANNLYHFSKKPLNSFYSLGGEVGVYFNDKLYFGLAQYSSLAPSDIWKDNPYNPDRIQVYEYSFQAGYKFELASPFYIYAGIRSGYGAMHMEYRYNNGVDSDETMTREKSGGIFATPDAKLGIKVHKYVNVEAGLNYRYYIGSKDKWGLSTDKMNGVGAVVSIVGNIPL
ncbi:outer membrane beta-barrel protein [Belliella marina]|uniref:Outer membrane beta-barrel protein n=1 Tax=Belliella marina TaxID=1644146 RepID=A0ABW4VJ07_9BACT